MEGGSRRPSRGPAAIDGLRRGPVGSGLAGGPMSNGRMIANGGPSVVGPGSRDRPPGRSRELPVVALLSGVEGRREREDRLAPAGWPCLAWWGRPPVALLSTSSRSGVPGWAGRLSGVQRVRRAPGLDRERGCPEALGGPCVRTARGGPPRASAPRRRRRHWAPRQESFDPVPGMRHSMPPTGPPEPTAGRLSVAIPVVSPASWTGAPHRSRHRRRPPGAEAFALSQTYGEIRYRWDPFVREQHLLDGANPCGQGVRTSTRSRHAWPWCPST